MPTIFFLIVGLGIAFLVFSKLAKSMSVPSSGLHKIWYLPKRGSQLLALMFSQKSSEPKGGKGELPRWVTYVGLAVLVALLIWGGWIWDGIQATGFNFATDVDFGRLLASHYGEEVAQMVGWILLAFLLLLVTKSLWRSIPWKTVGMMLIVVGGATLVIFAFLAEDRHWDFQKEARLREQARLDELYQRGPPKQIRIPHCNDGWREVKTKGWKIYWDENTMPPMRVRAFQNQTTWIEVSPNATVEGAVKFWFCTEDRRYEGSILAINPERYR